MKAIFSLPGLSHSIFLISAAMLLPLPLAAEDEDETDTDRYSVVSQVLDLYFNGWGAEAQKIALSKAEGLKKTGDETLVPAAKILEMLANKVSMSEQQAFDMTKNDPQLWALASLGFFVKYLSQKDIPQKHVLLQCLDNYKKNYKTGSEPSEDISKWAGRLDAWYKWCEADRPFGKDLEPLLKKASVSSSKAAQQPKPDGADKPAAGYAWILNEKLPDGVKDIGEITPDEFKALKEGYKNRPRPPCPVFDEDKEENVKKYIASLPEGLRKVEGERFNNIRQIKDYIGQILHRNQYKKGVKLLKGQTLSGTITMANDSVVVLKVSKKKAKSFRWDELALQQYIDFLDYFAQFSLKATGGEVNKDEGKKNAAEIFLLAALLCDWYEKYDDALKFARKGIDLAPENKQKTSVLLLK